MEIRAWMRGTAALFVVSWVYLSLTLPQLAGAQSTINLVTSQSSLGANDSVDWGSLGNLVPTGQLLLAPGPFTAKSLGGLTITGSLPGGQGPFEILVQCTSAGGTPTCGVFGNFSPGDKVLFSNFGSPGPLTLAFSAPVAAVGMQIEDDAVSPGSPFTAIVQAFNGSTLLGTVTEAGISTTSADGSAIFIGVQSTSANITSIVVSTQNSLGTLGALLVNKLFIQNNGCPVHPNDITLRPDGLSLDLKPTLMFASFVPSSGLSLAELASECGFTGFDWVQTIEHWPGPSGLFAELAAAVPIIIPPQSPIKDPPFGGYTYAESQEPPFQDAYPFYYNPVSVPSECAVGQLDGTCSIPIISNLGLTLNFADGPTNPCLPGGELSNDKDRCQGNSSGPPFMTFTTQLVGICNATPSPLCSRPGEPSAPLFQWTWNDNFDGKTAGGIFNIRTASLLLPDPSTGTGGITITTVNGVPQTPPNVSCTAEPSILWPPNGKQVSVNISGNISTGTSAIAADSVAFSVTDSEGQVQPSGSIAVGPDGTYSLDTSLIASREGHNKKGRQYTIVVRARDTIGNIGACSTVVTVPHDQGH